VFFAEKDVEAMAWIYLLIAGLFEIVWALGMKKAEGFTRLWPTVWTIAAMIVSFVLLGLAVKSLPVGTAYAVWTGIGAAGTAAFGIVIYNEAFTVSRVGCILLIVSGTLGLKLLSPPETPPTTAVAAAGDSPGEVR
jgi:quaternary ammonium compound-resistance protein SugE